MIREPAIHSVKIERLRVKRAIDPRSRGLVLRVSWISQECRQELEVTIHASTVFRRTCPLARKATRIQDVGSLGLGTLNLDRMEPTVAKVVVILEFSA
jgi:hypothetical protein